MAKNMIAKRLIWRKKGASDIQWKTVMSSTSSPGCWPGNWRVRLGSKPRNIFQNLISIHDKVKNAGSEWINHEERNTGNIKKRDISCPYKAEEEIAIFRNDLMFWEIMKSSPCGKKAKNERENMETKKNQQFHKNIEDRITILQMTKKSNKWRFNASLFQDFNFYVNNTSWKRIELGKSKGS